jgi:hypothetical protein
MLSDINMSLTGSSEQLGPDRRENHLLWFLILIFILLSLDNKKKNKLLISNEA